MTDQIKLMNWQTRDPKTVNQIEPVGGCHQSAKVKLGDEHEQWRTKKCLTLVVNLQKAAITSSNFPFSGLVFSKESTLSKDSRQQIVGQRTFRDLHLLLFIKEAGRHHLVAFEDVLLALDELRGVHDLHFGKKG